MGYSYAFDSKQRKTIKKEMGEILYNWGTMVDAIIVMPDKINIIYNLHVPLDFIDNFELYLLNYLEYPNSIYTMSQIDLFY
jgi:hypothetical protein